jgi:hypothetical protein
MARQKLSLQEKIERQKQAVKEAEAKVKALQAKQSERIGIIGVKLGLDAYSDKEVEEIMSLGLELFKDDGKKSVAPSVSTSNNSTIDTQDSTY